MNRDYWQLMALFALTLGFCRGGMAQSTWTKGNFLTSGGCPPFVFLSMPNTQEHFGTDAQVTDLGEIDFGAAGKKLM
jgi:hypothetical protein